MDVENLVEIVKGEFRKYDEKEKKKEKKEDEKGKKEEKDGLLKAQLKALDDVVAVNSLFTIAIFVGLSLASPNQHSLDGRTECDADPGTAQRLVLYEVVSFAFFLLSSLSAKTCKVILNTKLHTHKRIRVISHGRGVTLAVSASASVAGVVFLTLSMVNVVQIKIGKLSCRSAYAIQSVAYLCAIVLLALLIYGIHMVVALLHYILKEKFDQKKKMKGKVPDKNNEEAEEIISIMV